MKVMDRYQRRLYPGGRPKGVTRVMNRLSAWMHAAGVWPRRLVTLEVPAVAPAGSSRSPWSWSIWRATATWSRCWARRRNWVHNLRAAGGAAVLRHGARENVRLDEVEPAVRPPILRRYLACAPGARPHIPIDHRASLEAFAQVAPGCPVFRVVPR